MIVANRKKYPNPCETCEREKNCRLGYGCTDWQIRYRYRQKQINACAEKKRQEYFQKRFVYQHPDEIRRYLREWPCGNCEKEPECDIPCTKYLQWYDIRIKLVKRRLER